MGARVCVMVVSHTSSPGALPGLNVHIYMPILNIPGSGTLDPEETRH